MTTFVIKPLKIFRKGYMSPTSISWIQGLVVLVLMIFSYANVVVTIFQIVMFCHPLCASWANWGEYKQDIGFVLFPISIHILIWGTNYFLSGFKCADDLFHWSVLIGETLGSHFRCFYRTYTADASKRRAGKIWKYFIFFLPCLLCTVVWEILLSLCEAFMLSV